MAPRIDDAPARRPRALVIAAVLLALPLAAACQSSRGATGSIPEHGAAAEEVVLDLPAGAGGLSPDGRAAARDFVAAYAQEGIGPLQVVAADGDEAYRAVGDLRRIVREGGVPEDAVTYDGRHSKSVGAPLVLSYRRAVAAAACGRWPANMAGDWRNLPYENFGCATRNNLAVMVEDPRDLHGPRPQTGRDAQRRDTVFENYRAGQRTAGETATDSAATASDVGN